jgi:23S rRNA pseudouridine2605 synthase
MTRERLQRFLARSGVASRRVSERLIADGRVRVNGMRVTTPGTTVDAEHDRVEVDAKPVRPSLARSYVALNKPVGIVSTASDPQGRQSVVDLVDYTARLYPVGRLDYDTEGLLLLTDDGDLAMRLTHPRYGVEKEYRALIRGPVDRDTLRGLSEGIVLEGRPTAPARFEVAERTPEGTWLRVTLHEGRNRQIRRMVEAMGVEVGRLVRIRVGTVRLGQLAPGEWRHLTDAEVATLQRETA